MIFVAQVTLATLNSNRKFNVIEQFISEPKQRAKYEFRYCCRRLVRNTQNNRRKLERIEKNRSLPVSLLSFIEHYAVFVCVCMCVFVCVLSSSIWERFLVALEVKDALEKKERERVKENSDSFQSFLIISNYWRLLVHCTTILAVEINSLSSGTPLDFSANVFSFQIHTFLLVKLHLDRLDFFFRYLKETLNLIPTHVSNIHNFHLDFPMFNHQKNPKHI